ncbi:YggS family pyridoxal phosphate-dependent enzyme [Oscillatoria sp. FACHB-1406]|uniref:YggS family pyridoxal phosphate-dependent enzyme n=1 Tax=Oscillatoria sp. FACHB-1406 TaxID=2692846 RepID=UPI001686B264|nr:YggS family pyridoxal phosphate-dependent enzyme [Oscillatoria sp. FACHB-1406]MBD2579562.1 YggS family pyridoxal phosphate-dependent enzyme [Oscillatoria sp. FACHB-1406]
MTISPSLSSIAQRLVRVRAQLPANVRLIAVTKQVSVEAIRAAYAAGQRDFAESRLQEALPKQEQLQDCPDICWHFIGHLQSNKAQKVLEHFPWIHTCDSLKLAQRLDRLAEGLDKIPQICVQVKVLPDPQKYGWSVPELFADLPDLNNCRNLDLCGLMAILPLELSPSEMLSAFQSVRTLGDRINDENYPNLNIQEYSMGMSDDYPLAVQAGATMVRLGRILFGDREN